MNSQNEIRTEPQNLMKISIQAKSSSGKSPYVVDFKKEDELLSAACNCQAGIFGKLCKHKSQLLSGDASILWNECENEKLLELQGWVKASSYALMHIKLTQIESDIAALKKEVKKEKKNIELKMKEGF